MRPLAARVNDEAGLLAPADEQSLEAAFAAFEGETGHQIALLTVKTLDGEAIESFSLRVAEAWKLGDAKRDDGAIVVVASEDRRARIEVGYGLEGVIPDALAARILREQMVPWFKRGEMGQGVQAGVQAVMLAARGEVVPPSREPTSRGGQAPSTGQAILVAALAGFLFALLFSVSPSASGLHARGPRGWGGGFGGGGFGGGGASGSW